MGDLRDHCLRLRRLHGKERMCLPFGLDGGFHVADGGPSGACYRSIEAAVTGIPDRRDGLGLLAHGDAGPVNSPLYRLGRLVGQALSAHHHCDRRPVQDPGIGGCQSKVMLAEAAAQVRLVELHARHRRRDLGCRRVHTLPNAEALGLGNPVPPSRGRREADVVRNRAAQLRHALPVVVDRPVRRDVVEDDANDRGTHEHTDEPVSRRPKVRCRHVAWKHDHAEGERHLESCVGHPRAAAEQVAEREEEWRRPKQQPADAEEVRDDSDDEHDRERAADQRASESQDALLHHGAEVGRRRKELHRHHERRAVAARDGEREHEPDDARERVLDAVPHPEPLDREHREDLRRLGDLTLVLAYGSVHVSDLDEQLVRAPDVAHCGVKRLHHAVQPRHVLHSPLCERPRYAQIVQPRMHAPHRCVRVVEGNLVRPDAACNLELLDFLGQPLAAVRKRASDAGQLRLDRRDDALRIGSGRGECHVIERDAGALDRAEQLEPACPVRPHPSTLALGKLQQLVHRDVALRGHGIERHGDLRPAHAGVNQRIEPMRKAPHLRCAERAQPRHGAHAREHPRGDGHGDRAAGDLKRAVPRRGLHVVGVVDRPVGDQHDGERQHRNRIRISGTCPEVARAKAHDPHAYEVRGRIAEECRSHRHGHNAADRSSGHAHQRARRGRGRERLRQQRRADHAPVRLRQLDRDAPERGDGHREGAPRTPDDTVTRRRHVGKDRLPVDHCAARQHADPMLGHAG